jgi:hypothetical protein
LRGIISPTPRAKSKKRKGKEKGTEKKKRI